MLKLATEGRDEAAPGGGERTGSVRWALASLSLSMLLPSLGTSIANVGLPTLARVLGRTAYEPERVEDGQ